MSGDEGARADGLAVAETITQTILAIQAIQAGPSASSPPTWSPPVADRAVNPG
jgi:hypothetical protein